MNKRHEPEKVSFAKAWDIIEQNGLIVLIQIRPKGWTGSQDLSPASIFTVHDIASSVTQAVF
jgi:hypothetical protein